DSPDSGGGVKREAKSGRKRRWELRFGPARARNVAYLLLLAGGEHRGKRAIDAPSGPSENESMSEVTFTAPRRSGRVFHKMRVQAHGRAHDGRKFREVCQTQVVNSHGGLLLLKNEID